MKRLLLVTLLLAGSLVGSYDALAQKKRAAFLSMGSTFGFKGGIGIANLAGDPLNTNGQAIGPSMTVSTFDSKLGIVVGGLYNYRFTPLLSVQAEALFSGKGFKVKSSNSAGARVNYNASLQYIEIPLMGKINAKIFYLEAGVVPSILAAASFDKDAISAAGVKSEKKGEELTGINSFEACWAIGGGLELVEGFCLGIRHVRASQSVGAKSGAGELNLTGRSLVNTSTQITAGYIFNHSYGRGRRRH